MKTKLLFPVVALALVFVSSCNKLITLPGAPSPVQHPFLTYVAYLQGLNITNDSELVTYIPVLLNDQTTKATGTGQAEYAFAFRSANPGVISQLGIYAPIGGVTHTVTLWDSATGQVLVQLNITTNAPGEWTYSPVGQPNQVLGIEANHGYIIGFNTLPVGIPINSDTLAKEIYAFNGIYDFKANAPPGNLPMLPFTEFGITFEGWYLVEYITPISAPIFPPPGSFQSYDLIAFFSPLDIEFTPAP
jgi:hypothetical protein